MDLHIGNALFERGQLDEAEQYWKRALKIFLLENETSPVTNTAKLKLSMIDIQRGNYDAAMYVHFLSSGIDERKLMLIVMCF